MLKTLLFVQLLYVVNQVHFPWLQTGVEGVAPSNVIFLFVLLAMRDKPETVSTRGLLYKPILYFFAALTFAFLWGQLRGSFGDFVSDLTYLKNALFYPLFYFIYLRCRQDEKTTRQLIIWILIIAAVAGLEAFHEGLDYGFGRYHPLKRASGPFGVDWHNANRAGVFYAMFIPMFIALALFLRGQKLWRLAAFLSSAVIAAGTLSTYSRQAYALVLLAAVLLLLRRNIIIAVLIGASLVSLAGYLPDSAFQRVQETKKQDKAGDEEVDDSTSSRWEIWAGAMSMLAANPLGVGLNHFKKEIGNYCSHKGFDAHNFYVLTMAECGPFGIAALLYLIWSILKLARYLRRHTPKEEFELNALTIGFSIAALNMALGGIYGSPTLEGSVMAPFWALAGLLERYVLLKAQNGQAPTATAQDPKLADQFPLAAYILPGRRS